MASIALIILSFLAFTPLVSLSKFISGFFDALYIKAVVWSPFIGFEYSDLLFENIFNDVKFQLNPIKPKSR